MMSGTVGFCTPGFRSGRQGAARCESEPEPATRSALPSRADDVRRLPVRCLDLHEHWLIRNSTQPSAKACGAVRASGVVRLSAHQKPSTFHQTLPTTAKIISSTTHITNPTRHQVPIVTYPLPKMIGEVPVA